MKKTYKRIIVSRTDKIGDLILSIPSFYMLKKMYPEAEIIVLVRKYNYGIIKNLPCVDRAIKIDDYKKNELLEKMKYFNADVFIALFVDDYVMQLAKASKAKIRIGPISKLKSFFTFNKGVLQKRSKSTKNEAEYNLDLIKKLNKKLYEEKLEITTDLVLDDKNILAADKFFEDNKIGKKVLVVNPFDGGSAKNITALEYAKIISNIMEEIEDLDVIIITHVSEEEKGLELIRSIGEDRIYLFANGGDLLNIGAVINRAKVYLGSSTGPTHIAGALKKSIVAIYPNKKTQRYTRWGVFGNDNVTYIVPDEKTAESYKHKTFTSYNKDTENLIIKELIRRLEINE